ncbi:hypothetical protein YN80_07800 [Campylobacter coli]|nr:hypothetical protein [Campylobacter coli]
MADNLEDLRQDAIGKIQERMQDGILESENAEFLTKLLENANAKADILKILALGMTYKKTGFHFEPKLEKNTNTINYFKKNESLSFTNGGGDLQHKLIIGDNYHALLNLLITHNKENQSNLYRPTIWKR